MQLHPIRNRFDNLARKAETGLAVVVAVAVIVMAVVATIAVSVLVGSGVG